MQPTGRDIALRAIDDLWERGAKPFLAMAQGPAPKPDWAGLIPIFSDIETTAREAREALECAADQGEPEPLRQARLIFRMLEAASAVITYAWIGGDYGYGEDIEPWVRLGGETIGLLPKLREFVSSIPQ